MIGTIGSSFLLTWAGKQYDKFGARWVTIAAALLLAFVLLLLSQSDHLVRLFVKDRESGVYAGVAVAVMVFLFSASLFGAGCVNHGFAQYAYEMVYCKAWFCKRNCVGVNHTRFFHCTAYLRLAHSGTSWRYAWIIMAFGIGIVFMLIAFLFFRDNPEDMGMVPDGEKHRHRKHNVTIKPFKQYTLSEARKTFPFWLYSLPLAFYALYITGFTFNLISIFDQAGLDREKALVIFIPISFASVGISFFGGWISDRIKLKYLLYIFLTGELIALYSLANMNDGIYYYGFIVGHGMANGLYNVLMTVTWPRFYGRKNLGRISGFVMSLIVFFSAIGPVLFSFSLTRLGTYSFASYGLAFFILVLLILSYKGNNPQDKFEIEEQDD